MALYKQIFGMDVLVFDDVAAASLMTQFTGQQAYSRRAALTLNMQGGGGFELWQYTEREPLFPERPLQPGMPGLTAVRLKTKNVQKAHQFFTVQHPALHTTDILINPAGSSIFYVEDADKNLFLIEEGISFFGKSNAMVGGVHGACIGVTDMKKALVFYKEILGISQVTYDVSGEYSDTPGGQRMRCRRVLLQKPARKTGAFSQLLGGVSLELIQQLHTPPLPHIYANRFWGDIGFIHLCLDVTDMDALEKQASQLGFSFSVDSKSSFTMQNASGRFCYLQDPDGTLIELVETHRVPMLKKWGLYLDLKNRKDGKPLPAWMIRLMGLNKVK